MPDCFMIKKIENIFDNRWQRWLNSFFVNISVIVVFCAVGYAIDVWLKTKPWWFLTLLMVSFPVSLALQIYKIKKM